MAAYPPHDFTVGSTVTRAQLDALGQGLLGFNRTAGDLGTDDTHRVVLPQIVTVLDSRAVAITVSGLIQVSDIGAACIGGINRDGTAICTAIRTLRNQNTNEITPFSRTIIDFPGASGNYTYSVEFWRNVGTGQVTILDDPSQIMIVDVRGV